MLVAAETKQLLIMGGIADQPGWFIRNLAWFGPEYDLRKFQSRAKMILGDDSSNKTDSAKNKPRGKR
jgi:hypothetical protein